jgi:hypothetical protein
MDDKMALVHVDWTVIGPFVVIAFSQTALAGRGGGR